MNLMINMSTSKQESTFEKHYVGGRVIKYVGAEQKWVDPKTTPDYPITDKYEISLKCDDNWCNLSDINEKLNEFHKNSTEQIQNDHKVWTKEFVNELNNHVDNSNIDINLPVYEVTPKTGTKKYFAYEHEFDITDDVNITDENDKFVPKERSELFINHFLETNISLDTIKQKVLDPHTINTPTN